MTNDPIALHAAGDAAQHRGDYTAAVDCYRQALAHGPRVATLNNLAIALKNLSRPGDALTAFRAARDCGPAPPSVLNNIGNLARQTGELDEALAAYEACLALRPSDADTLNNYAAALLDARRWDESIAAYDLAIAIDADHAAASGRLYALHFLPEISAARLAEEHDAWGDAVRDRYAGLKARDHAIDGDPDRRLRVGFISPNFEWHCIGRFLLPLLENLDRSIVEIFCYSDVARPDAMTARFEAAASVWRVTRGQDDASVAALVRADGVDILIDLALHLSGTRLNVFARRPAPVQATYLAYCSTSGLAAMDYRLTDPFLDPPQRGEKHFRERVLPLAHSYWCYPPPPEAPPVEPPPILKNGFATFGCLNNFRKISPAAVSAWCELLRRVPASRLILHAHAGRHRQVLRDQFSAEGIAADRLIFQGFSPFADYLASYHAIDIALDTFPCSGGTTTCDALWMGAAVVTLAGDIPTARSGVSILNNIGHAKWIASDVDTYVSIAADVASRPDQLTGWRAAIRERMLRSPLMQTAPFCRDFEIACRQMWQGSLSRYAGRGLG